MQALRVSVIVANARRSSNDVWPIPFLALESELGSVRVRDRVAAAQGVNLAHSRIRAKRVDCPVPAGISCGLLCLPVFA
jgi:hypothetical protein